MAAAGTQGPAGLSRKGLELAVAVGYSAPDEHAAVAQGGPAPALQAELR